MAQYLKSVKSSLIKMLSLFTAMIMAISTFAQDKKVDVTITTDKDNGQSFFAQPWVWVVGGAVFIIILVAILKGRGRKSD